MILHTVFCAIKPDVSADDLDAVKLQLAALSTCCEGFLSFDFGPNIDLERKSQGYSHGFLVRFTDRNALEQYAVHPDHQTAGAALIALCEGGADGILVFDLDV
jgi:hypothetical protein